MRVVTIGYEGRTVEELVDELTDAHVTTVVDVRQTPISRKAGFSKRQLEDYLAGVGIAYIHERDLGNPKENREAYRNGSSEARERFKTHLAASGNALVRLAGLSDNSPIALLCYERAHSDCHRESVADALLEANPNMEILIV